MPNGSVTLRRGRMESLHICKNTHLCVLYPFLLGNFILHSRLYDKLCGFWATMNAGMKRSRNKSAIRTCLDVKTPILGRNTAQDMPLRGALQRKKLVGEMCINWFWGTVANGWNSDISKFVTLSDYKGKCRVNSSTEQASGFSVKTEKCEASGKDCRSLILTFKETDLILGLDTC